VIRQQMEDTRSSLQDKLETLEEQVKSTVQEATDTVATVKDTVETVKESVKESVETVKESVQDTVTSVKNAFNLDRQVREHPWAMFAGATVLGFLGGRLVSRLTRSTDTDEVRYTPGPAPFVGSSPRASFPDTSRSTPSSSPLGPGYGAGGSGATAQGNGHHAPTSSPPEEKRSSWFSSLTEQYSGELNKLKGLAIGAVGGVVRDLVTSAAPPAFVDRLKEVVNNVTEKLGGERFEGPILHDSPGTSEQGAHREQRNEAEMGRPLGAAQR